jgi:cytochrome P450
MAPDDRAVVEFDQHSSEYRETYPAKAHELREQCPIVWSTKHDGFWVVTGHEVLSAISKRTDLLSNDHDPAGERNGYEGIAIPSRGTTRGGFIEMDPPEQSEYRRILNPFLSPAAVKEWVPFIMDFTRACIDDVIETGRLDFVDDFANVVPAVLTMAMLGLPLSDWEIYCEPAHMQVYTAPDSPNWDRMIESTFRMVERLAEYVEIRKGEPRPGMISELLNATISGEFLPDDDIIGTVTLLIGGGFDTTTSLLAGALDWLDAHPEERPRLLEEPRHLDLATEEFLRHFTPAQGGGRTVTQDCEVEGFTFSAGDRMFLSYAMCNHDPASFPNPDEIVLDRFPNPHAAFGLGVHRCIGSNLARLDFKLMLREALRRMPDYRIDHAGKEQYESIGTINGYKHLPATFTRGRREGPRLAEVMADWQARLDAEPAPANLRAAEGGA